MDEKPTYEELEYRVKVFEREAVWRKQAEDALRESEEKYKHLTEELSDVVLTITLDGSLSYISPAIKEFGGYDPKKEVGNNIAKYFAKKSELIAALNLIEKISIDKTSSSIEFLFKPKNIEPFYVEVTGKPLIRKNKVVIIQCVMRDISERKQTEDALLESEEKYRLLIDNLPNIVFKGYKNGSVDFIDDKIELLTGYKKEEFNSRKINGLDIVVEEDKEKMRQTFIEALKSNKSYIREYRIKTKAGGVLWIQEGSQIVCDDSEEIEHISGAFLDITERRRIEIQLQQMDRIESMGALAGGIAHDFNNLLMGIQGRTSLMLLDSDSPHSNFEHLKGIDDYVKSAADLTKQLLGFARAEKYKVKTTDLNEVIKKQNQMFGRTRKEINILEKYEEKLWATEVDQGQIERVLLNIFVNAWQAMPGGGNIHIQTENIIIDENYNKPYHMRPGKYIRISVTDTGFGMDEATQRKVFDPFFTTKGIGIGTGLGLASAYGIIKNHSGYIDVYSEKDKGTTFEIYLPASEKEDVKKEKLPEEMLGGTETILFVDDEYVVIDAGQQILKTLGYTVFQVRSGKEAIEVYRKNQNEIDMVILDMIMPEMSGGDTYDRLKEINPDIKGLLSSGYSIDGQATDILKRGCNGFIQKPFNISALSEKIREVLDKK